MCNGMISFISTTRPITRRLQPGKALRARSNGNASESTSPHLDLCEDLHYEGLNMLS